jgi:hypothetical protein
VDLSRREKEIYATSVPQRCLSRDTIALLGFAIKKPTPEFVVSRQSARWSETRGSGFHYFTPRTSPHLLSSRSPVTSHPRRSLTPYRRDLNGWLTPAFHR